MSFFLVVRIFCEWVFFTDIESSGVWVARSGAMIVVVGMLVNFLNVRKLTTAKEILHRDELSDLKKSLEERDSLKLLEIKFKTLVELDNKSREILLFQAGVLIFGTLIWGAVT